MKKEKLEKDKKIVNEEVNINSTSNRLYRDVFSDMPGDSFIWCKILKVLRK